MRPWWYSSRVGPLPSESLDLAFQHVKRYTPLTLTRRRDIERDLEETRDRGYAVNRGEFRVGVCGIGVPVRDRSGGVVAAIGVWGAERNILGARETELAHMAVIAARDVSRALGYIEGSGLQAKPRAPSREFIA